jgi:hypothetical protein
MIDWSNLPPDIAHLYNPAFLGELVRGCAEGYGQDGMPLIIAYIALPLLLYKDSRESLNSKRFKYLRDWIEEFPETRISLATRSRALKPYVTLAIIFAVQHQTIHLSEQGQLHALPYPKLKPRQPKRPEPHPEVVLAKKLGKLLVQWGQLPNLFIALGVSL